MSYLVTSRAVLTLFGFSQFRVREGLLVSKVDLRHRTGPGIRPADERETLKAKFFLGQSSILFDANYSLEKGCC